MVKSKDIIETYLNLNHVIEQKNKKYKELEKIQAEINLLHERINEAKLVIKIIDENNAIQEGQSLGYLKYIRSTDRYNKRYCLYSVYYDLTLEFMGLPNSTFYEAKDREDMLNAAVNWIIHEKLPENTNNER